MMKFTDSRLVGESSFRNYYFIVSNTSVIPAAWIQQLMGIIDVLQLIWKLNAAALLNWVIVRES